MCTLWETQHISICGFYFSSSPPTDLLHSSPVIDIHIKCPTHVRFILIYFITLYYHFYAINLCAWLYFLFLLLFYYSHLLYTLKKKTNLLCIHMFSFCFWRSLKTSDHMTHFTCCWPGLILQTFFSLLPAFVKECLLRLDRNALLYISDQLNKSNK